MTLRRDQGIVLRGYPFGEADRIVVFLSPNHGKVRAVAKGIRRTKSRFGGRLEPLTHVDLVLYQGRNLAIVTQVSVIEPFPHLRRDLDAVLVAGAMAEAIGKVVVEGEPSHRLFLLLQRGASCPRTGCRRVGSRGVVPAEAHGTRSVRVPPSGTAPPVVGKRYSTGSAWPVGDWFVTPVRSGGSSVLGKGSLPTWPGCRPPSYADSPSRMGDWPEMRWG